MKTPEELKELQKRINEVCNELAELSPDELAQFIDSYTLQNKARRLSHEELTEVAGGGDNDVTDEGTEGVFFVPVTIAVNANINLNTAVVANINQDINLSCSTAVNALTDVAWTVTE